MPFDRKVYFDSVRESLFWGNLDQQQVDGQEAILRAWELVREGGDLRHLAYMLATALHETASTMWPIEEWGKGQGSAYGQIDPVTGYAYYGRGLVQLTWDYNYKSMGERLGIGEGLYENPDLALTNDLTTRPVFIASRIMFAGMFEGLFRPPNALGVYFNEGIDDPVGARDIINGDVQKNGPAIAEYHNHFLDALNAAYIMPTPKPDLPGVIDNEDEMVTIKITVEAPKGVRVKVVMTEAP